MAARTREDELKELPQWRANKAAWEPGVRTVGLEELDCLGIDRHGNLYWDGKPVEVRHVWTRWQKVGAVVIAVSAIVGAIGAATQVASRFTAGSLVLLGDGVYCVDARSELTGCVFTDLGQYPPNRKSAGG
jgi:hypothetical protein